MQAFLRDHSLDKDVDGDHYEALFRRDEIAGFLVHINIQIETILNVRRNDIFTVRIYFVFRNELSNLFELVEQLNHFFV